MAEKTYTREVINSITLGRDGKRIELTTGMMFEFTEEEYKEIMKSNPSAVSSKVTVDLDSGDVDPSKVGDDEAKGAVKAAAAKTAPAKSAKKASDDL